MNWLITENKKRINISDIPVLSFETLREEIINLNKFVFLNGLKLTQFRLIVRLIISLMLEKWLF